MHGIKSGVAKIVPSPLYSRLLSVYHYALALFAALWYGSPARQMLTIGVTGTKGKTSVTEMISAILEEAGHTTAVMNSIRFKTGDSVKENRTRMSMPGRFFIQWFLREAVQKGCTAAVLEMTSEGARQHRHRFIDLNALVFTNLSPEHIESHGSYAAYADAKFEIGRALVRSRKRPRVMVANADDKESSRYLLLPVEHALPFSLLVVQPAAASETGGYFTFDETKIDVRLPGEFSLKNALAAATVTRALGIPTSTIAAALVKIYRIPGRAERIELGQNFTVIVDYAHTPDSLQALYDAYTPSTPLGVKRRLVCVLSATGGGRDAWKRPVMGAIAEKKCAVVILTDEDPYDEDPQQIVEDIAHGMQRKPEINLDRRAAIRRALEIASTGDTVLITGKGTNHSISVAEGKEIPWDDASVVREEIASLLKAREK